MNLQTFVSMDQLILCSGAVGVERNQFSMLLAMDYYHQQLKSGRDLKVITRASFKHSTASSQVKSIRTDLSWSKIDF